MSDSINKDEFKDLIREVVKEVLNEKNAANTVKQDEMLEREFHSKWVQRQINAMAKGSGNPPPFDSKEEEEEWKKELLKRT